MPAQGVWRRCSWFSAVLLLLTLLPPQIESSTITTAPSSSCETSSTPSPFRIIIDGGSTGSRLHIFEFDDHDRVHRRGSHRVDTALSDFADDASLLVEQHLLPLMRYAASMVPARYHATTVPHYAATAGLRLLSATQRNHLYETARTGLQDHVEYPFATVQLDTLPGHLEGYYGAVAANVLLEKVRTNLTLPEVVLDKNADDGTDTLTRDSRDDASSVSPPVPVLGALDMGGASTQLVFYTGDGAISCQENRQGATAASSYFEARQEIDEPTCKAPWTMNIDDFFSNSYLSYGVDQFRERIWTLLVTEHEALQKQLTHDSVEESVLPTKVSNPCSNRGHSAEWMGHVLNGSGNAEACASVVRRLIPHAEHAISEPSTSTEQQQPRTVGSVEHPPLRGTFVAMSLYFYALDSVRHYTQDAAVQASWPKSSLSELTNAVQSVCNDKTLDELCALEEHPFTRPEALQHRCMESVYIVTLLRDGYGFDEHSRDITFSQNVNNSEVEWTLGMALQHHHQENSAQRQQNAATTCGWDDVGNATKLSSSGPSSSSPTSSWVKLVAQVLVSDGELFTSVQY